MSGSELTRRQLLVSGAAAAGYALAAGPVSAEAVRTDSEGLVVGDIEVPAPDGTAVRAYRARPDGDGPFPVMTSLQLWCRPERATHLYQPRN